MNDLELYLSTCWSCDRDFFKKGKQLVRVGNIRMGDKKKQLTMEHPLCESCFDGFLEGIVEIIG